MHSNDEESFKFLTENSADMIFRSDFTPHYTYVSPSSFRILGRHPEELLGCGPEAAVYADDLALVAEHVDGMRLASSSNAPVPNLTIRMCHKDGSLVWMEVSARMILDPETKQPREMILIARDITERKRLEDQLLKMALTDGLTGLANRRAFDAELEREWSRVPREGSQLSLVLIDIDHFKMFNDEYGHPAGDECLRAVGAAVRSAVRIADTVARYGGEELAIILPATGLSGAYTVAEIVRRAVEDQAIPHARNFAGGGRVTISLGVASALERVGMGACMPQSLIVAADRALYMAKHEGRNCVRGVMMMPDSHGISQVA